MTEANPRRCVILLEKKKRNVLVTSSTSLSETSINELAKKMNFACALLLLLLVAPFCQFCSAWPWEGKNTLLYQPVTKISILHIDKRTFTIHC